MLLFDTSALIELESELAGCEVGAVRSYLGRNLGSDVACSTVSIGEFACGSNETATRILLRKLRKIPLTEAIAYRAATLDKLQLSKGQRLGENDTWIAATAMHYSATLVHVDKNYLRIAGLKQACLRK
jgi:predicted nucleic acid-binding protein